MKKQRFKNKLKDKALDKLDRASLDDDDNDLTTRCKFNFSYFDYSQDAGQNFSDISENQLQELINSLKEFSRRSLKYWENQGTLIIYHNFPIKTEFFHPKHVPHQVHWGRFRLGNKLRLVGFRIPSILHKTLHQKTKEYYDKNTFYIVFIDQDHLFWKTEKK